MKLGILVVEKEESTRQSLVHSIIMKTGLSAWGAGSLAEARMKLQQLNGQVQWVVWSSGLLPDGSSTIGVAEVVKNYPSLTQIAASMYLGNEQVAAGCHFGINKINLTDRLKAFLASDVVALC